MCNCKGATDSAKKKPDKPCDEGKGASCSSESPNQVSKCPSGFNIEKGCRLVSVDGSVTVSVSELDGYSGGTFTWSTTSTKIKLSNTTGLQVTVNALKDVSSGRDAETIKIIRTGNDCPSIEKTVALTVAKLTFSESATQRYGYDNNDTPADVTDDHICIKQSDHTFVKVVIEGGALGTDFDFVCDTPSICTPVAPGAEAQFELRLDAGSTNKGKSLLHAKCKCSVPKSFGQINVCVYKEKVVEVVVAKIDHPDIKKRSLRFPAADYAGHAPTANAKLKEAVVKYDIINFSSKNEITPIAFTSGTGILTFDINSAGGADLTEIKKAMTGTGTRVRVAIIRDMKSYYYLSKAASIGDTTLTVKGASVFFNVNDVVPVGTGASSEQITVKKVDGNLITCSKPLTKDHAVDEPMEFPAAGWSSDPILIMEGNASELVAKWTVLHEVGHRALGLTDINDNTDFMHYMQSWTDYRLRYCPRKKYYKPTETENQWETIPRT